MRLNRGKGGSNYVLPGGGPWLVRRDCPAVYHNTLRATRSQESDPESCICPRAQYLLKLSQQRTAELRRQKARLKEISRSGLTSLMHALKTAPDLSAGACQTPAGRAAHDRVWRDEDTRTGGHPKDIAAAKQVCATCPVAELCLAWALASQDAPELGLYGGKTPAERAEMMTR